MDQEEAKCFEITVCDLQVAFTLPVPPYKANAPSEQNLVSSAAQWQVYSELYISFDNTYSHGAIYMIYGSIQLTFLLPFESYSTTHSQPSF